MGRIDRLPLVTSCKIVDRQSDWCQPCMQPPPTTTGACTLTLMYVPVVRKKSVTDPSFIRTSRTTSHQHLTPPLTDNVRPSGAYTCKPGHGWFIQRPPDTQTRSTCRFVVIYSAEFRYSFDFFYQYVGETHLVSSGKNQ